MRRLIIKGIGIYIFIFCSLSVWAMNYSPDSLRVRMALKIPGNQAVIYQLYPVEITAGEYEWRSDRSIPVKVVHRVTKENGGTVLIVELSASQPVFFHYDQEIASDFLHEDCQFYMPGFWYRRNLRSPHTAPSFHIADSWQVREDRLSAPLAGIYNDKTSRFLLINRLDDFMQDALSTHYQGEIILSGKTSLGFTGFQNQSGYAALSVGFPYRESPKSYVRKLTLAPETVAFQRLDKGDILQLRWNIREGEAADFSDFVRKVWEYSYDAYSPQPLENCPDIPAMKENLSKYFEQSIVTRSSLVFNSGVSLRTHDCLPNGQAEIGFVGRVLLNAYNALEYGNQCDRQILVQNAQTIFESYLSHGFTPGGFLKELVNFDRSSETDVFSIRRQSEGLYALFYYLDYERKHGRRHEQWELRLRRLLDMFLVLQNGDGSFPRKFHEDMSVVDSSGGSTSSATLPLLMGYKYFRDKRYLQSARLSVQYIEKEIISKADYFSSTLDANCEDKEAAISAATATYYIALLSKGEERRHFVDLSRKASYFALSWYYLWDVPFARGQMLGDLGLKSRGWGNVSVENNHIDVFVFDFVSLLRWLSHECQEPRFERFAEVISTSMRQLLPQKDYLCGVAREGYYPEVVQHTQWDYGKNGKGYYNDIFAPGWTVASLWELFTPGRVEQFLLARNP